MTPPVISELERVRARILTLLQRVPDSVNSGSYDAAIRYKKAVKEARKQAEQKHPKYPALQLACHQLENFR